MSPNLLLFLPFFLVTLLQTATILKNQEDSSPSIAEEYPETIESKIEHIQTELALKKTMLTKNKETILLTKKAVELINNKTTTAQKNSDTALFQYFASKRKTPRDLEEIQDTKKISIEKEELLKQLKTEQALTQKTYVQACNAYTKTINDIEKLENFMSILSEHRNYKKLFN